MSALHQPDSSVNGSFQEKILPAPVAGALSLEDYWVWCASVIHLYLALATGGQHYTELAASRSLVFPLTSNH